MPIEQHGRQPCGPRPRDIHSRHVANEHRGPRRHAHPLHSDAEDLRIGLLDANDVGVHNRLEEPSVPSAVQVALHPSLGVADDAESVPVVLQRARGRDGAIDRNRPKTDALVSLGERVDDLFGSFRGCVPTRVSRIRK